MRLILVMLFLLLYFIVSIPIFGIEWIIGKINPHARDISSLRIVQFGFKGILFFSGTKTTVIGFENMPKDNIDRAIKNAMGKDQSDYKGMTYEGYGPHGIAVFVDTLTDNTTRTVADVRSVFNKFGGNLGTMGSLAFLFDHKCMFTFKKKDGIDMEELILDLIDYDVDDEFEEDEEEGTITIYGDPKSYAAIQKHLEECGFEDVGGEFTYIPNDTKEVTPEQRETLDKMIERLEEFDDVQTVYTNMKPEGSEE